jgi:hypothetical protein
LLLQGARDEAFNVHRGVSRIDGTHVDGGLGNFGETFGGHGPGKFILGIGM